MATLYKPNYLTSCSQSYFEIIPIFLPFHKEMYQKSWKDMYRISKYPSHQQWRPPFPTPPQAGGATKKRRNSPSRALWPLSSGKNLLSTAHTRRWSGRLGDLAPTRRKPAGTSMGSLEMETRRRSFPAWQKPRRGRQGSHTVLRSPKTKVLGAELGRWRARQMWIGKVLKEARGENQTKHTQPTNQQTKTKKMTCWIL